MENEEDTSRSPRPWLVWPNDFAVLAAPAETLRPGCVFVVPAHPMGLASPGRTVLKLPLPSPPALALPRGPAGPAPGSSLRGSDVGGIHRPSGFAFHWLHGPAAEVLGSERLGTSLRAADRGAPRGPSPLLVPRPRCPEGREVLARRRDVPSTGAAGVGVPEQEGRTGRAPVRGQAGHRRQVHLQGGEAGGRSTRRASPGPDGVLRGQRRGCPPGLRRSGGVQAGSRSVPPGVEGSEPRGKPGHVTGGLGAQAARRSRA